MDISNQVTDGYKMKRGNYAVSVNDRAGDGHSVGITITRIITKNYTRSSHVLNGQGAEGGICDSSIHNRQKRTTMCQAHSLQGESIQRGLAQQKEWGSWNLATTMGETRLVVIETDGACPQVCAPQIRYLVRSVQVPPGKELVLENESA